MNIFDSYKNALINLRNLMRSWLFHTKFSKMKTRIIFRYFNRI